MGLCSTPSTPAQQARYKARYVERAAFIASGLPTAASLATIAVALILNGRIESRMDSMNHRLEGRIELLGGRIELLGGRIDRMATDLSQFYRILGRHDKAIGTLETK